MTSTVPRLTYAHATVQLIDPNNDCYPIWLDSED
jgi:hypothetical protein